MKCAGCNREAKYVLFKHYEPHCQIHFEEAVDGCTVPTQVMTVDGYEGMLKNGQGKDYPKAS